MCCSFSRSSRSSNLWINHLSICYFAISWRDDFSSWAFHSGDTSFPGISVGEHIQPVQWHDLPFPSHVEVGVGGDSPYDVQLPIASVVNRLIHRPRGNLRGQLSDAWRFWCRDPGWDSLLACLLDLELNRRTEGSQWYSWWGSRHCSGHGVSLEDVSSLTALGSGDTWD